ncbi:MAG: DEAD/DEAH box helicase [Firmicutes bacterium]|nr:DEAD/DEAH box helicase [Bacillota bacterium]
MKAGELILTTFNEFGISEGVLKAISLMGFEEATPIQEEAIPVALAGGDLIGQAHTGTGKTAAFGVPLAERLQTNLSAIQALVVTPTRELAVQVAEELNKIGQFMGVRTLPVYGGQDIGRQIRGLQKRPQIIVGTPGRLLDHIRRGTVRLDSVKTVILDEADEMLNMGFIEDIEAILQETPPERQTLLFSATMPRPIQQLAQRFMKDPKVIAVRSKEVTVPNTEQFHMVMDERQKFDILCRLLDTQSPALAIVFGRTKRRVDELNEALSKRGYSAEGIHGDMTQARRDTAMRQFKEGIIDILVATDVAARGLDIEGVTHVYNFDIPQDPESYVHRIGRTGRAGKSGVAITFVTQRELSHLRVIENGTKRKIPRESIPTIKEAIEGQQRLTVDRLLSTLETEDTTHYLPLATEMLSEQDPTQLLAAALKLLTKEPDTTPVRLTAEGPQWSKRSSYQQRPNQNNRRGGSSSNKPYAGNRDRNRRPKR